VLLALMAGMAGMMTMLAVTARVDSLREPVEPVPASAPAEVVVVPGDTLWSIAERVAPGRDPRAVVDQLRRINGLPSGEVAAGQRLLLRAP
jgi:LysM repeat protein